MFASGSRNARGVPGGARRHLAALVLHTDGTGAAAHPRVRTRGRDVTLEGDQRREEREEGGGGGLKGRHPRVLLCFPLPGAAAEGERRWHSPVSAPQQPTRHLHAPAQGQAGEEAMTEAAGSLLGAVVGLQPPQEPSLCPQQHVRLWARPPGKSHGDTQHRRPRRQGRNRRGPCQRSCPTLKNPLAGCSLPTPPHCADRGAAPAAVPPPQLGEEVATSCPSLGSLWGHPGTSSGGGQVPFPGAAAEIPSRGAPGARHRHNPGGDGRGLGDGQCPAGVPPSATPHECCPRWGSGSKLVAFFFFSCKTTEFGSVKVVLVCPGRLAAVERGDRPAVKTLQAPR